MTDTKSIFGYKKELDKRTEKERIAAAAAKSQRNDTLLAIPEFREFLATLANRLGYFTSSAPMTEWDRGYRDGLRDIVDGVVMNSENGAQWLADYARTRRAKRMRNEK